MKPRWFKLDCTRMHDREWGKGLGSMFKVRISGLSRHIVTIYNSFCTQVNQAQKAFFSDINGNVD